MDFRVLGPVEAGSPATRLPPKPLLLLATLLCEANIRVGHHRLVEALWGARPPDSAASSMRIYVSQVRQALRDDSRIVAERGGYRIRIDPGELDSHEFEELVRQAASADTATAGRLLGRALRLWRGPAFADLEHHGSLSAAAVRLEELRVSATEQWVAAELGQGRHREVLTELQTLVRAHPLRERLCGLLMLALYRSGRQAEALEAYARTGALLAEELGVDPGAELRRVYEGLLRGDEGVAADLGVRGSAQEAAPVLPLAVPRELPAPVPGFTGRQAALAALDRLLPGDGASPPMAISAIAGAVGVGKTALAVHWAHRVAGRFPDGQLYVNLRGYDRALPMRPLDALAGFLLALGVPRESIPGEVESAAARFRSVVAGRRILVLLDNAGSADQVRPLLPGTPGCLVLVTSRDRLTGLLAREGASRVTLGVLSQDGARALLTEVLGPSRVEAEPGATAELAELCGRLPLALRIATAYLFDHPGQTIADYVHTLRTGDPMTALAISGEPDAAVRAAFDLSYGTLDPAARRVFRLLGLVPCDDFDLRGAGVLAGMAEQEVAGAVDRLADAHLIEWHGGGRFGLHDLLRRYAGGLARQEDGEAEQAAARRRLFTWTRDTTATGAPPYPGYAGCPRSTACRQWT
ncbi:MAG: hypothetical protein HOV86_05940 [Thermoactinospora sp.]|nr:hypothetical protein [Thermoactinospora sp.]